MLGLFYLAVLATVPLAGGRLTSLADLRLRKPGLALAAIVMQIAIISLLPAGSISDLFEKTGPAGRSRSQGGLGLGLYLCRLVVERSFGGRIWVASSTREGTTFKFTVPSVK